jgi:hypothetical protein
MTLKKRQRREERRIEQRVQLPNGKWLTLRAWTSRDLEKAEDQYAREQTKTKAAS